MKNDIKHTAKEIARYIKQSLKETLEAWMEWTVCGETKSEPDADIKGGGGTSEYTTYVIGPCITRLYTGQKR